MSRYTRVSAAAQQLIGANGRGTSLSTPLVLAFPIDRAAVSTLARPFETENVSASDETSARIAQIELDLGQGPAWSAAASRATVSAPDLRLRAGDWPMFAHAMERETVRSVYALPLRVGTLDVGAVDLYSDVPDALTDDDLIDAEQLAKILATELLRRALDRAGVDVDADTGGDWFARREVHQATGMVIAHYGVAPDDALVILRAQAFALGRPLHEVAAGVISREIPLDPNDPPLQN